MHVGWNASLAMAAAYTLVDRNKNMNRYVGHITSFTVTYFVRAVVVIEKNVTKKNNNGHPKHMPDETKKTCIGLYKDGNGFNCPSSPVAQWDCYGDNDCAEHTVRVITVAAVSTEWLTLICSTHTSES